MTPQEQSYRLVPLTQGQWAIVDVEDYERVMVHKWHAAKNNARGFYAARSVRISGKNSRKYTMARFILRLPHEGRYTTDHINGNTLDNRKANLRVATFAENARNRRMPVKPQCAYKGVSPIDGKFMARIRHKGKLHYLGMYPTPELAHEAYYAAAVRIFGEFACR